MSKRSLSIILFYVPLVALFCFLGFSYYIHYQITSDLPPGPPLQMSRVDFQEPFDSLQANKIKSAVLRLEGVRHAYINTEDHILVYSHDPKVVSSTKALSHIREQTGLSAQAFVVDEKAMESSCPVTGSGSIFMQVGGFLAQLF